MLLRRLLITSLSSAAALIAAPTAGATALPGPHPLPVPVHDHFPGGLWQTLPHPWPQPVVPPAGEDQLTILVAGSGDRAADGAYTLDCHPAGGTHREAEAACDRLDALTRWGEDPFAPVSPRANCTAVYGGPATAHISGTWAGRPVNAHFDRRNGCEIARWNRFRPVLPEAGF